jgi:hypothetical protein
MCEVFGYGEIGEEGVVIDTLFPVEKFELVEQVTIHEDVARARGQVELVVPELERLRDTVPEEIIAHHEERTFFRIAAEATIEIADARGLDAQSRDMCGPGMNRAPLSG